MLDRKQWLRARRLRAQARCWPASLILPLLVACGPKEKAAAPEESVPDSPANEPVPAPSDPDSRVVAEPESEAPPAKKPEPVPLEPLCQAKCDRLQARCTPSAVETCRAGCDQWLRTPAPCSVPAEAALTCARDASDLGCVPIAPESCGKRFAETAMCLRDPEGYQPVAEEETPTATLPAGWDRVVDEPSGFTIAMPSGAVLDTAGGRTWRATNATGVPYTVRVLAPLEKQPDAKAWVKLAAGVLAPCNLKTRLHGLIEKPTVTSMRYDSECQGSGERHGTLYVLSRAFVVTAIEGPQDEQAEVFLYGLEPR